MKPSAHLHLLIRANIDNPPGPNDCESINKMMKELVSYIRMNLLSEPQTLWCDEVDNVGITSFVLLTTSHSVMHIWNMDEPNRSLLQFDLFSCAKYSVKEVLEFLNFRFKLSNISY